MNDNIVIGTAAHWQEHATKTDIHSPLLSELQRFPLGYGGQQPITSLPIVDACANQRKRWKAVTFEVLQDSIDQEEPSAEEIQEIQAQSGSTKEMVFGLVDSRQKRDTEIDVPSLPIFNINRCPSEHDESSDMAIEQEQVQPVYNHKTKAGLNERKRWRATFLSEASGAWQQPSSDVPPPPIPEIQRCPRRIRRPIRLLVPDQQLILQLGLQMINSRMHALLYQRKGDRARRTH